MSMSEQGVNLTATVLDPLAAERLARIGQLARRNRREWAVKKKEEGGRKKVEVTGRPPKRRARNRNGYNPAHRD